MDNFDWYTTNKYEAYKPPQQHLVPQQPQMQPCAGRNCGSTNPNLHSAECFEDYEKSTGMAQPEQEPVAWLQIRENEPPLVAPRGLGTPVYTAPRQWQGLDEVEIVGATCECVDDGTFNMDCAMEFARVIETRLKEKNT